jgi:predicted RNase H-like HicB family nuclease
MALLICSILFVEKRVYYHFKVHKDPDGLWAECIELEGCVTQSEKNTMEDLRHNMAEALNLYLDEPASSKIITPYPKESVKGRNIEKVRVEPGIAFAMLVRQYRLENGITQKQMAESLKMKNLILYQRLEKKGDPRLSTINKVSNAFPDIPLGKYLF